MIKKLRWMRLAGACVAGLCGASDPTNAVFAQPAEAPAEPSPTAPAVAQSASAKLAPKELFNPPYSSFKDPLPMISRATVPEITGATAHAAMDPVSARLFIAAKSQGAILAMDVVSLKIVQSIEELAEPQDVLFLDDQRRLIVSCGGDGAVVVYKVGDDGVLTKERSVQFIGEADSLVYEPSSKRVYVGHARSISWFDPATGVLGPEVQLGVAGSPEGMALEPAGGEKGTPIIWINVAATGQVMMFDVAAGAMSKSLTFKEIKNNHAMAIDTERGRLFIASRQPGRLIVIDTKSRQTIALLEAPDDIDDLWWDALQKRVYATGGAEGGRVVAYQLNVNDTYTGLFTVLSAPGARTSLLVPSQRRLYVMVPRLGDETARVFTYIIGP